jgi:hypothetical protein
MTVTNNRRDDVDRLSAEESRRLRNRERRAMHVSELTYAELNALERIEIPAEAAGHDHEMTQSTW